MSHFQRILIVALCCLSINNVVLAQEVKRKAIGLTFEDRVKFSSKGHKCLVISLVSTDSIFKTHCPAKRAGLKDGDYIFRVNSKLISSRSESLKSIDDSVHKRGRVRLSIFRSAENNNIFEVQLVAAELKGKNDGSAYHIHKIPGHPLRFKLSSDCKVDLKKIRRTIMEVRLKRGVFYVLLYENFEGVEAYLRKLKGNWKDYYSKINVVSKESLSRDLGEWTKVKLELVSKNGHRQEYTTVIGTVEGRGYVLSQRGYPKADFLDALKHFQCSKSLSNPKPAAPSWGRAYQAPGHNLKFVFPKSWSVTFPKSKSAKGLVLEAHGGTGVNAKTVAVAFEPTNKTLAQNLADWEAQYQAAVKKRRGTFKVLSKWRLNKAAGEWTGVRGQARYGGQAVYMLQVLGVVDGRFYGISLSILDYTVNILRDPEFSRIIEDFDYSKSNKSFDELVRAHDDKVVAETLAIFRSDRRLKEEERRRLWSLGSDKVTTLLLSNFAHAEAKVRFWSLDALCHEARRLTKSHQEKLWAKIIEAAQQRLMNDESPRVRHRAWSSVYSGLKTTRRLKAGDNQRFAKRYLSILRDSKDPREKSNAIFALESQLRYRQRDFLDALETIIKTTKDGYLKRSAEITAKRLRPLYAGQAKPKTTPPKPKATGLVCEKCQKGLRAGAKFCDGCGHKVGPAACSKCQHKLRKGAKFCDNCGAKQK